MISPADDNSDVILSTDAVITLVLNGASSKLQINSETPVINDLGALDMGGFTLGARADGLTPSNITVYEAAIYSVTHDAPTEAQVISFLTAKWGI